jgi:hypothetical protein
LTKAEKLTLAETKSRLEAANILPFNMGQNIQMRATAEWNAMMDAQGKDTIKGYMDNMTVDELKAVKEETDKGKFQETSIANLTKFFCPNATEVANTIEHMETMKSTLEAGFQVVYVRCYFDEKSQMFDNTQFTWDIDMAIAVKTKVAADAAAAAMDEL